MTGYRRRPGFGSLIYFAVAFMIGLYFVFASVQGDFGLFRRLQLQAEADALEVEKAALEKEVAVLANKTRRLSDEYLDLDLLDEQARDVLGLVRADEIVIQ